MAMTFMQMAEAAMAEVDGISVEESKRRVDEDPNALIIDVQDAAELSEFGLASGGQNISLGNLPVKADTELPADWTDPGLQDRSRQIIVTCAMGPNAARGAKLLKDMGFTNVSYMEGGMEAWSAAGLPIEET
jgi:rhodanese-related sulfurtransferase